ncbi:MAG: magnesium/cobalt transporter CorA [Crocinitomicaceae bacterium]
MVHSKSKSPPPGSFILKGEVKQKNQIINAFRYSENDFEEINEWRSDSRPSKKDIVWINLEGMGSVKKVAELAAYNGAHKLQVEDILSFNHRPKAEIIENTLLFIYKRLELKENLDLEIEQISLLLRENTLISFQEVTGDSFDHLRKAIIDPISMIRTKGANYLFYRMIDSIVDSYFQITDDLEEQLSIQENLILNDDHDTDLTKVIQIKKAIYQVKKNVRPLREANIELKSMTELNVENMDVFLTDLNDHLNHILDQCDSITDSATNVISIYHSNSGNRLNEIMKRLTIVSTIFIPLSFLAGLYGMNFVNMPELQYYAGYPILIGIMIVVAVSIYIYMKRSNWF